MKTREIEEEKTARHPLVEALVAAQQAWSSDEWDGQSPICVLPYTVTTWQQVSGSGHRIRYEATISWPLASRQILECAAAVACEKLGLEYHGCDVKNGRTSFYYSEKLPTKIVFSQEKQLEVTEERPVQSGRINSQAYLRMAA